MEAIVTVMLAQRVSPVAWEPAASPAIGAHREFAWGLPRVDVIQNDHHRRVNEALRRTRSLSHEAL